MTQLGHKKEIEYRIKYYSRLSIKLRLRCRECISSIDVFAVYITQSPRLQPNSNPIIQTHSAAIASHETRATQQQQQPNSTDSYALRGWTPPPRNASHDRTSSGTPPNVMMMLSLCYHYATHTGKPPPALVCQQCPRNKPNDIQRGEEAAVSTTPKTTTKMVPGKYAQPSEACSRLWACGATAA